MQRKGTETRYDPSHHVGDDTRRELQLGRYDQLEKDQIKEEGPNLRPHVTTPSQQRLQNQENQCDGQALDEGGNVPDPDEVEQESQHRFHRTAASPVCFSANCVSRSGCWTFVGPQASPLP